MIYALGCVGAEFAEPLGVTDEVPSRRLDPAAERLISHFRDEQAVAKLIGGAPAFLTAVARLREMARSDATVLITGETGTGKELVARAIHYLSDRAPFAFVAVNCGLLTDTLLEDELFGHERGAFTDAQARRPGLIAQAERGTLLLDEVDTLTTRAQVALLRLLQDKTFRVLGSSREQRADVRFIAATNGLMSRMIESGRFRADLYYRLCVFAIRLPPLRERREDIVPLAEHFVRLHAPADRPAPQLSESARAALVSRSWPGNVRELENAIIRGVQVAQEDTIAPDDLGLPSAESEEPTEPSSSFQARKRQAIEAFERRYLIELMTQHRGNISHAARAAGKERRDLGRLLKKYALDRSRFAAPTIEGLAG